MKKLLTLYLWIIYCLLYIPIFIVIAFSFNNSKYTISWKGFTLKWYSELIGNTTLIDATFHSITLATISATCATILGTLTALVLRRYSFWGNSILYGSIYALTVVPDIVIGIAFLIFFISLHIELGFIPLVIAHTTLGLPFVTITVLTRLSNLSENLVEAAKDLGATEWQAIRLIILPLLIPSLIAGWFLSFTLSLDDILISFFLATPEYDLLSLQIYSMVRLGVKPDINALSSIMFLITVTFISLSQYFITLRRK